MQDTLRKARASCALIHARSARASPNAASFAPALAALRCHSPPQVHAAAERGAEADSAFLMTSMERMRARCTVPRDVVLVYESLNKVGLQYGPAFRLLTDVYVPEAVATAQAGAHAAH